MHRVPVIGICGAGKSTSCGRAQDRIVHLDDLPPSARTAAARCRKGVKSNVDSFTTGSVTGLRLGWGFRGKQRMSILPGFADVTTGVLLPAAVAAISVSAAIMASAALARRLARSGKVWVGQGAGRTRVSPYVLIGGLVAAGGALFFLAAGLYDSEQLRDPVAFYCWAGLVSACALGAVALPPFALHTWEWDSTGLRWRGAWRSVEMHWPGLVRLGKRFDGQLYVSDRTGRKIAWWPDITLEHEALLRAIRQARPDLRLPG